MNHIRDHDTRYSMDYSLINKMIYPNHNGLYVVKNFDGLPLEKESQYCILKKTLVVIEVESTLSSAEREGICRQKLVTPFHQGCFIRNLNYEQFKNGYTVWGPWEKVK